MTRKLWIQPVAALLAVLTACEEPAGPERNLTLQPGGPLVLDALGDTVRLNAIFSPDTGLWRIIVFASSDTAVAQVNASGLVRATGNGMAWVTAFDPDGAGDSVNIVVSQSVVSIDVVLGDTLALVSVASGALLPVTCVAVDRNGFPLPDPPVVVSAAGSVSGGSCETLVAVKSGYDTLTITSGPLDVTLSFAVALLPQVSSPVGEFVALDSFPFDYRLWAPSGRTNSQGEVEIYVTGYRFVVDSNGVGPGVLHRLISNDGVNFHYDGVALDLLPAPCELICSGIENIAVVPRDDGVGWRMYFAAGTTGTYGWQVFSAVSSDERNWTIEPGVRITNGGVVPPAPAVVVPWPVGEGMVLDQLPGGEWRMVVGGYERIPNPPDRFEIVEYRSSDQVNWTYQGAVLTTADMPPGAQRSLYGPSIVEIAPGLWRMFVTGDDLGQSGGRSRIFSATSRDRTHWQFEAELLGTPGSDLYYTALVGDRLYFLRQDGGQLRRLAAVTLTMP